VWGLVLRVRDLVRVLRQRLKVNNGGLGFRVQGLGFRV
jgi:hypothetical protein